MLTRLSIRLVLVAQITVKSAALDSFQTALLRTQEALLRSPAVRVGPSSLGPSAGDGVFACRRIEEGELVTWSVQSPENAPDTSHVPKLPSGGTNPYAVNTLELLATQGNYELADPNKRCPETDGVGHLINDGACIEAFAWTDDQRRLRDGQGEVRRYLKVSEDRRNVERMGVGHPVANGPFAVSETFVYLASRDIDQGEELFTSYGPTYWLRPMEQAMLHAMQICRVDLRVAANIIEELRSLPDAKVTAGVLRGHAEALFDSCANRLDSLLADYATARREAPDKNLEPYEADVGPHKSFDGYFAHAWIQAPPESRRGIADYLKVYEPPFLPVALHDNDEAYDHIPVVSETLKHIHGSTMDQFQKFVLKFANPPFSFQHALTAASKGPLNIVANGHDPELPW